MTEWRGHEVKHPLSEALVHVMLYFHRPLGSLNDSQGRRSAWIL